MKVYKKPTITVKGITKQIVMQKKANCSSTSGHSAVDVIE